MRCADHSTRELLDALGFWRSKDHVDYLLLGVLVVVEPTIGRDSRWRSASARWGDPLVSCNTLCRVFHRGGGRHVDVEPTHHEGYIFLRGGRTLMMNRHF